MNKWVKPKSVIPVHGEHRHMVEHINFAKEMQVQYPLQVENGDIVKISKEDKPEIIDKAPTGRMYLDGSVSVGEDSKSIKERKHLSFNGLLEITIIVNEKGNIKKPFISLVGLPISEESKIDFQMDLEEEIYKICKTFSLNSVKQEKNFEEKIKSNCRKIIKERTGKRPFTNINLIRY